MENVYNTVISLLPELSLDDMASNEDDFLFWASFVGETSAVRDCLAQNTYDINKIVHNKRSAIMAAAANGEQTIYHVLLSEGADLTYVDEDGNNCLHLAAQGGNESIVSDLLSWNLLNINSPGYLGRSAVQIAALKSNEEAFHVLLSAGADLTSLDDQGNNCLHLAVEGTNKFIVKDILSNGILDVNSRGYMGRTAVMMAVMNDSMELVDVLVSAGADLSIRTDKNNDCLAVAVVLGFTSMLGMLLEMSGTDINCRGQHGRTPLMIAALLGKPDEFGVLVSANADLSVQDDLGNDCLMLASAGGCLDVVQNLISLSTCDVNKQQENEATPVMAAVTGGHLEVFEFLVSKGADMSMTCFGNDCLIMACEGGNVRLVEKLISLEIQDINIRGQNGWTPLMMAARNGEINIFKFLVSKGADVTVKDEDSNNCLILASIYGQTEMVEYLCLDQVFDINQQGQNGMTAVMAASNEGNEDVFDVLVTNKADISYLDENDSTCLILASIGGSVSIVQKLLATEIFDIEYRCKDGWTALTAAAVTGNGGVFEMLILAGADVTVCDRDNDNCLMLACIGGDITIVDRLISMNILDVNAKGSRGWTAAMFAAFYGKTEILGMLMAAGADVSLTDDFGNSCLILATAKGQVDTVRRLLEVDSVEVSCRGRGGCTPILLAAHVGHKELFELLHSRGADLSAVDDYNASVTHYTSDLKDLVRDIPAIKTQQLSEMRGSFIRSSSFRGSFRGSFNGKLDE